MKSSRKLYHEYLVWLNQFNKQQDRWLHSTNMLEKSKPRWRQVEKCRYEKG